MNQDLVYGLGARQLTSSFQILNLTLTLGFKKRSGLCFSTWAWQIPAECYFQMGSKLNHLVNPKCIISVLLCCNKSSTFAVIVAKQYLPIFAILSSHHINVFLMLPHQYKPDLLVKRERVWNDPSINSFEPGSKVQS